ncbi:efflux RND transporter periplasmic adaptor subunit [Entomomonas moraniae]|uniref:Efflux RND transporter periplasmic adaptor subunit n=1 Tax=Entomomonas moraniae TaxID=2213226 RepID=A0A3S9XCE6_9GAMM|nr:efflux RND transporter periplasmic adaptor subunit [Entomomonas moraniae]AZS50087.1 efflux RND transporter periplasmic adaptor subunit [Entomomonas moraniae]
MPVKPKYYYYLCALLTLMLQACEQSGPDQGIEPAPIVSVMTTTPIKLSITEDFPSRVLAIRTAEIRPQVNGIIRKRLFEEGTEVLAGQPLFQINPAPFQIEVDTAAAALQKANAALLHAKTQLNRMQSLVKVRAVSRQQHDDAVSQRDQALADVAQARATLDRRQLDLKFASVEAPISGRIDQAFISEGALVSSNDTNPMAYIQQIDQIYVDVRLPISSLEILHNTAVTQKDNPDNRVSVVILRNNGTPYDVKGQTLFSGVNVDKGTGDVLLRILVDNPERQLLPGMFVRARVPLKNYDNALMVPQQAIIRLSKSAYIWIIDTNNHAHLIPVKLGELANRQYRIEAGLRAGQKVVIEGVDRLSEDIKVVTKNWKTPSFPNQTSSN